MIAIEDLITRDLVKNVSEDMISVQIFNKFQSEYLQYLSFTLRMALSHAMNSSILLLGTVVIYIAFRPDGMFMASMTAVRPNSPSQILGLTANIDQTAGSSLLFTSLLIVGSQLQATAHVNEVGAEYGISAGFSYRLFAITLVAFALDMAASATWWSNHHSRFFDAVNLRRSVIAAESSKINFDKLINGSLS